MPVQIITDSACDLPQDEAKRLGVQVIPLTTCFGMDVYRDGVDLTNHQFFRKVFLDLPDEFHWCISS